MVTLLDSNVLIALLVVEHVHHDRVERWWASRPIGDRFATTPSTQGSLVRFLIRDGISSADARAVVERLTERADHSFWADDFGFAEVTMNGVIGHRQVTDAYLAEQARRRSGRLVTLDEGLSATHPDVAELIGPADV